MSAKILTIDIETYRTRNPQVIEAISREQRLRQPARNAAKEDKMNWHTAAAQEERISEALAKTSVDPLFAEVLCVSFALDDDEPNVYGFGPGPELTAPNEVEALESLRHLVDTSCGPNTTWVGHNLKKFDLAVLLNRYRALRIEPPVLFPAWTGRYWDGRVYDTMDRTPSSNGLGMVSLDDACLAYGIVSSKAKVALEDGTPVQGSTVGLAFERGEFKALAIYAMGDIFSTRDLYRVQTFGGRRECWASDDEQLAEILEIRDSGESAMARSHLILNALVSKGMVSRDLLPREAA